MKKLTKVVLVALSLCLLSACGSTTFNDMPISRSSK